MATSRKRWFRVADSILREDLTSEQRSTFLGLLAWFNQRRQRDGHRGRRAQQASIPPGDLLTITLAEDLETARERCTSLQFRFELNVERRGAFTFIEWPNLAKFQEWGRPSGARRLPADCPAPALSGSDPKPNRTEPKMYEARTPAPPATTTKPNGAHPPLSDAEWSSLRVWADAHVQAGKLDRAALDPGWLADQVERCTDHWAAKGKRISRWPAAIRNWIRKAEEFRARDAPAKASQQGVLAAFVARGANGRNR